MKIEFTPKSIFHGKDAETRRFTLLILAVTIFFSVLQEESHAQDIYYRNLVQFSGVVVNADNLQPVPFVNIMIKNKRRGTVADYMGYFSFVAHKNDVIEFSAMGYKKATFTIPDTITSSRYSLIQLMTADTIMLSETVIYPWPTLEQFREAFVKLEIPDDDITRAQKNLELAEQKDRIANDFKMDGPMAYRNYIDKQTSKLYYAGQVPPNNLLNPFAWAQFIKAWKEGRFRIQK